MSVSGAPDQRELASRRPVRRRLDRAARGVESNARLTGMTAAALLVLLVAEGVTVLRIRPLLAPHVFIGMLLVPPVALKMLSTGYRFVRYYTGAPGYRRKGPPAPLLRLLGPVVVVLTVALFASGIGLLFAGAGTLRADLFSVHQASFVLWFGAMALHVLAHLLDTARLAPRDFYYRTRRQIGGAGARQWAVAASLAVGVLLGVLLVGRASTFLAGFGSFGRPGG
ncbi:MAG: hypothetical protein M0Z33_07110 [Actinomycetota bacterium]|nr:hypothetical protein [Actinomycetota bacterium]